MLRRLLMSVLTLASNHYGVVCKLDIKKAYDHVSWDFFVATFKKKLFLASSESRFIFISLLFTC